MCVLRIRAGRNGRGSINGGRGICLSYRGVRHRNRHSVADGHRCDSLRNGYRNTS